MNISNPMIWKKPGDSITFQNLEGMTLVECDNPPMWIIPPTNITTAEETTWGGGLISEPFPGNTNSINDFVLRKPEGGGLISEPFPGNTNSINDFVTTGNTTIPAPFPSYKDWNSGFHPQLQKGEDQTKKTAESADNAADFVPDRRTKIKKVAVDTGFWASLAAAWGAIATYLI